MCVHNGPNITQVEPTLPVIGNTIGTLVIVGMPVTSVCAMDCSK